VGQIREFCGFQMLIVNIPELHEKPLSPNGFSRI
jgi:hypothetical protein